MTRPIYDGPGWPRDFPDRMYFGTLIHFLNKGLHREADAEDVILGPYFVDRPSAYKAGRLETFDEQRPAHVRAGAARATALRAVRAGEIMLEWLDRHGAFHPVPAHAWDVGAADDDLTAILTRFSLPKGWLPADEVVPFGNLPSIYVPAHEAAALIASVNPRLFLPTPPAKSLQPIGAASPSDDAFWSVGAAVVWVATHDVVLARGAHDYTAQMKRIGFEGVQEGALELLARDEIAYHHCQCRRPVCLCWDTAVLQIKSRAALGDVVALGLRNDGGDRQAVPAEAWRGHLTFGAGANLMPEREGGTTWAHVLLRAPDVKSLWPAQPPALAGKGPVVVSSAPVKADVKSVTLAIFRERLKSGDTFERQQAEAGAIWSSWRGPVRQPAERRVYEHLGGRHKLLRFHKEQLVRESAVPVIEAIDDLIGDFAP